MKSSKPWPHEKSKKLAILSAAEGPLASSFRPFFLLQLLLLLPARARTEREASTPLLLFLEFIVVFDLLTEKKKDKQKNMFLFPLSLFSLSRTAPNEKRKKKNYFFCCNLLNVRHVLEVEEIVAGASLLLCC